MEMCHGARANDSKSYQFPSLARSRSAGSFDRNAAQVSSIVGQPEKRNKCLIGSHRPRAARQVEKLSKILIESCFPRL
ncbi:hypothetical protein CVCC1112_2486 [Paenarthrobacter nicotinovorans]|nr:hypothetical protein CVCC1112_2486 [Paenarthrobacter nicotinovorans]